MAFDLLPLLRPHVRTATICVRVSRRWEFRGGTDSGPIGHIDLVLVDEMGNSMYGEIPGSEISTKGPLVQEGGVYVISRFRVSNAKSGYMPVPGPFMVEFTCHTVIHPAKENVSDFPLYAYSLTPFADLGSRVGDTRTFTDVIGVLTEVSELRTVHLPNKPAPTLTRDIVLRDLSSFEMRATLWGQRASDFSIDGAYDETSAEPIVVLLVGNLVKSFQGQDYLSSNTACRWYFNPSIPEAQPFYDSLQGQRIEIRHVAPAVQQPQVQLVAEADHRPLQDLQAINPYDFPEAGYRCIVTIVRLVPGAFWFPSCSRCNRSCIQQAGAYKCRQCSSTVFRFKYKLRFVASDGTAEAEMVCFGDIARRIVGKSVQQVMRAARDPADEFPPDIAAIVSLKFAFSIVLAQQSYYSQQNSYQVTSVIAPYGRQRVLPQPMITAGASSSTKRSDQVIPKDDADGDALALGAFSETAVSTQEGSEAMPTTAVADANPVSPAAAENAKAPMPSPENAPTPPLVLTDARTSAKKKSLREPVGKGARASARRKLTLSADADDIPVPTTLKKIKTRNPADAALSGTLSILADESLLIQESALLSDGSSGADSALPQKSG